MSEKYYKDQEIGSHSVEFQKGRRTYFGVRVHGTGGILQNKASNVLLYISKGLHAFVYGYIHTDPGPFLQEIPEDHCLVAPIVEYHYEATNDLSNRQLFFKIKVPHCVTRKEDLRFIRVQQGDIHNDIPFTQLELTAVGEIEIDKWANLKFTRANWSYLRVSQFTQLPTSSSYFQVDNKYITIYTRHFSQFICTSCAQVCRGQGRAFMFGKITPRKTSEPKADPTASLRLYICSPLHKIRDYREVSATVRKM